MQCFPHSSITSTAGSEALLTTWGAMARTTMPEAMMKRRPSYFVKISAVRARVRLKYCAFSPLSDPFRSYSVPSPEMPANTRAPSLAPSDDTEITAYFIFHRFLYGTWW